MLQKQLDPALSAESARAASDRSRRARIVATRISPDAAVLPVNTLRFYIYFSPPAEAVFERKHVRLLDDRASEVVEPFLIFSEELWSADGRRLTLLMEPGRIKRGMGNAPSHYPALVEERTYILEVRTGGQVFAKTFSVSTGVATPLDETRWRVAEPRAGSRQPLLIQFDRVMDAPICEEEIAVVNLAYEAVACSVSLQESTSELRVTPAVPWSAAPYRLMFSSRLEDVCGNRLGEALDHTAGISGRPRSGRLSFRPR